MSGPNAPAAVMVHTHAGHAPTFSRLWASTSNANLGHVIDDALLTACREAPESPETADRVSAVLATARSMAPVVGVSCVLVGAVAQLHELDDTGVVWINDAAAAVAASLDSSRYVLVEAVAGAGFAFSDSLARAGVDRSCMQIELHREVWPGLAEEDPDSYALLAEVVAEIVASGAVVVLTQASMAPVAHLLDPPVAPKVVTTQLPIIDQLAAIVG